MAKKAHQTKASDAPVERFIRIVELPRKPGDAFAGYQPEIIWVQDGQVIRRAMVDKPNLFEYAFTQAGELIDPRNESYAE